MTGSITVVDTPVLRLLLARADDALVLGHRLSEWTGHGPMLEEDIALANLALDLIGQARALYALAVEEGAAADEDALAYLRDERNWRNLLLVEQPNGDFAVTIVRHFLYSAFIDPWWRACMGSPHPGLAAIAAKAEKESAYHLRHAADWMLRLGDGTEESHCRAQAALDSLWRFTGEMFEAEESGLAPDPADMREIWNTTVDGVLARATLRRPEDGWMQTGGRDGRHTEHMGRLLAELQYMQRVHPGARW
jgi:ring-1,2-phenylacetyl-CoA epoxidase subunit PaaC